MIVEQINCVLLCGLRSIFADQFVRESLSAVYSVLILGIIVLFIRNQLVRKG